MRSAFLIFSLLVCASAEAKLFQNSYVSFEVPDNWTCVQEGVAWTCTPTGFNESKEAVIVLAAKVAGPEDSLPSFLAYLKQPKKIATKVGTPMPSQLMYANERMLAGTRWIQAQHIGSEIQEYITLYLATVKDHLAILVSFSAEQNHYKKYNPIFDHSMKTLKIVASNQLLFPKQKMNASDTIGIQMGANSAATPDMMPPPPARKKSIRPLILLFALVVAAGAGLYAFWTRRKKISPTKKRGSRPK
jgi:hypothetical protein